MDSEFKSFLNELGISEPTLTITDENPPEQVEEERLAAFYRGELSAAESDWLAFLISRYRAWNDADNAFQRRLSQDENASSDPAVSPEPSDAERVQVETKLTDRRAVTSLGDRPIGSAKWQFASSRRLTVAALVLVSAGTLFWVTNSTHRPRELELRLLASATRGSNPVGPIGQAANGVYQIRGKDFYLEFKSPVAGFATIVLRTPEHTLVYPKRGQQPISVHAESNFEYGPLLAPDSTALLAIVVDRNDVTGQIDSLLRDTPPLDQSQLKALVEKATTPRALVSVCELQRVRASSGPDHEKNEQ